MSKFIYIFMIIIWSVNIIFNIFTHGSFWETFLMFVIVITAANALMLTYDLEKARG